MNVTDGYVEWKPGYDQRPNLHIIIEGEHPPRDEFVYQPDNDRSFWWAEKDGFYRYFAGHPDEPGDGFAGRSFTINTVDGEITLEGPYSGRAGVVNALGHGPCVDVTLHTNGTRGRMGRTATVALEYAEEAAAFAGVTLFRDEGGLVDGEFSYAVVETHPTEWTWNGEQSDRIMPYGEGEFSHPDGATIEVERVEWSEESFTGRERELTAHRAVLFDVDGEVIEDAITSRPDVAYHYLMAVHADRDPWGKAAEAPGKTEDYARRISTDESSVA